MIKTNCRHISLADISGLRALGEYQSMVHPIDYEFDLVRNDDYFVLGILTRTGTPWLYVFSARGYSELQLVPAALFDFAWKKIPEDWFVRLSSGEDIEFLPASLTDIEGWFEKYVSDDMNVVNIVEEEINRARLFPSTQLTGY